MKLSFGCLLWLVAAAVAFPSQSSPSAAQTSPSAPRASAQSWATIAGMVTKEPGSEAVKKAVIELIAENQSDGGNYTALTGADGSFQIEGIVPGRYHLFIERLGYLEVEKHRSRTEGRVLTLSAGQELKDLAIHLQAAAVVTGRVTDEDGDPMSNAEVAVLRQLFVSGRRRLEQVGAEHTNDLGEYRIASLAAGSYYVSVTPPPDFRSLIEANAGAAPAGPAHGEKLAPPSYQITYYPGTRERGQAAPIQLHAGDEFPANFSLTASPTMIVRGSVVGLPRGATATIMLQSKEFGLVVNGGELRKDGTFEIRDVASGAYTILATAENAPVPMTARQALQVTSANVDGLRLAPQPGATIRGRIRLAVNAASGSSRLDVSQLFLTLRPADGDDEGPGAFLLGDGFTTVAHVNPDGSVEWTNVPAGRYYVQLTSDASGASEWFVKSAVAGGSDIADAGLTVSGGTVLLDLVLSANGGVVEGIAASHKDEPVADAVVVAVPEARLRGHLDRFRKTLSDQNGRFSLHGLPPGNYSVYAWESVDGDAYYNPEFLKRYEGQANAVKVDEGDRTQLQLETLPPAEDQP